MAYSDSSGFADSSAFASAALSGPAGTSAALTTPPLPHRAEALAVLATAPPALAGRAQTLERSTAATPCVLIAETRVGVAETLRHDLALVDPDLDADPA